MGTPRGRQSFLSRHCYQSKDAKRQEREEMDHDQRDIFFVALILLMARTDWESRSYGLGGINEAMQKMRLAKEVSREVSETCCRRAVPLQNDPSFCYLERPPPTTLEMQKAAAELHCDEDHVGLYVADSDDSMGSSIATADVM